MRVTYLRACISGQLSGKARKAGSTAKHSRVIHRLTHFSTRTPSPRLKAEFKAFFAAAVMAIVSACTAWQTQENALDQISTINNMRYSQLLTNLSDAIDRKDPIPSSAVTSSGTATTVATGGLTAILVNPFNLGHNTNTLNSSAMLNWQNNWTITPVSDPQDIQNLRALAGLLYYSDEKIGQFISNTLEVYNLLKQSTPTDLFNNCGISMAKGFGPILEPTKALYAYFEGWRAFPDYYTSVTLPVSFPKLGKHVTELVIPNLGKATGLLNPKDAGEPTVTVNEPTATSSKASITVNASLTATGGHAPCYGNRLGGIAGVGLAISYGLLYPSKDDVVHWMRNGLSPACREYQLDNIRLDRDPIKAKSVQFNGSIFRRWLFWKDARTGQWAPYDPQHPPFVNLPPAAPESLGKYGNHEFWTTNGACLADFIVIGINATATSHAAALNAPKPTGTTAAPSGS